MSSGTSSPKTDGGFSLRKARISRRAFSSLSRMILSRAWFSSTCDISHVDRRGKGSSHMFGMPARETLAFRANPHVQEAQPRDFPHGGFSEGNASGRGCMFALLHSCTRSMLAASPEPVTIGWKAKERGASGKRMDAIIVQQLSGTRVGRGCWEGPTEASANERKSVARMDRSGCHWASNVPVSHAAEQALL